MIAMVVSLKVVLYSRLPLQVKPRTSSGTGLSLFLPHQVHVDSSSPQACYAFTVHCPHPPDIANSSAIFV